VKKSDVGSKQNNDGFEEGHRIIRVKSTVKVKLVVTEEAMKTQRDSRGMYSPTLSLTLALDGVGGQHHPWAALPMGKRSSTQAGLVLSGQVWKISPPMGFHTHRKSLYRL
jgi:hypothetical protein